MINKEIYLAYEKDLNGLKEYQKTILNNKLTSDYISDEWLKSKIDINHYYNIIKYLSNKEYEHKIMFEKTEEFNVVCSINDLISRYTLIIKSSISLEMQQFLVVYSSFKSELKKYMIAYGFLEELLLCDVLDGFEQEYKVSNNLLCSILRQNNYDSKGELSEFYYKRFDFNLHDDLEKVGIYNFLFFRSYISSSIMDISDINKKLFDEMEEIKIRDYKNNLEFTISLDSEGYNFVFRSDNEDYYYPIIYTNNGIRFILLNNIYYLDLDKDDKPVVLDSSCREIIIQNIQLKSKNPS
ncbi:hypothetical protein AY608_02045 [Acinetobacter terrae]|nr:hypothetical protein AY608_02045 [Acinetobacter terrae]